MERAEPTHPPLSGFWAMPEAERESLVLRGIVEAHARHFDRNPAYRRTVSARGVGPLVEVADLPRLLRPTSQTFKSYIEVLGTPFPQDDPKGFVAWLADQLSIALPQDRIDRFRSRYRSLEGLLGAVERAYADLGLEFLTSSGTSGRATMVVRDSASTELTAESFHLSFQRHLGMKADHQVVLMMPAHTRIAMARMAKFTTQRVGLTPDRVHFAIPFPAHPDQVRMRTGRTFREGHRGLLERRLWHPAINYLQKRYVDPKAIRIALARLEDACARGEKSILLGSPNQLHGVALELARQRKVLVLAPGSMLGTGGGMKDRYEFGREEIERDLRAVFTLPGGEPVPLRDTYGMAEANWVAMQCDRGNYHMPPWVHAATLDQQDGFQTGPKTTGLLAFFDPYGGGDLFPASFRTADQVTLLTGKEETACACGENGAYLARDSIQRVDLLGEAGCAAQV